MKKKFFSILLVLFLGVILVACPSTDENGGGNGNDDPIVDPDEPDEEDPIGPPPTEISIMHGAVHEVDPRNKDFSGRDRAKRLARHEEVEKELNVKIVYKPYPADATWGPGREEAIVNWHISGQRKADIYWLTTIWLANIASSKAIVPVDQWLSEYGGSLDSSGLDAGTYNGETYGFTPEPLYGDRGVFINTNLLEEKGIENPINIWNAEGNQWNWTRFEAWATDAQSKLGENQYVMGAQPSVWAQSLIPLNGGKIVDAELGQVMFTGAPALQTYEYLEGLYAKKLFEPSGSYDKGSDMWAAGDVLLHPGNLWFVRSKDRWGQFKFIKEDDAIGVVPFPLADNRTKSDYVIPMGGEAIYTIANNTKDKAKEELAFEVWNRLQLFETEQEYERLFETRLQTIFGKQKYVDVYLDVFDNVYFDIHEQIGIRSYSTSAWQVNLNTAVKTGNSRNAMNEILNVYQEAMQKYLGNE